MSISYSEALLVEKNEGPEAAVPLMEALAGGYPEVVEATVWLMRRSLEQGEPGADVQARALMQRVPWAVDILMDDLAAWLVRHGRAGEAIELEAAIIAVTGRDEPERSALNHGDTVLPHGIQECRLAVVRAELARIRGVRSAAVVRKQLPGNSVRPLYVFAVRLERSERDQVMHLLSCALKRAIGHRGDWLLYGAHRGQEGWPCASAVLQVPGAVIYPSHVC